jgi:ketosteroid isomerase-like protein
MSRILAIVATVAALTTTVSAAGPMEDVTAATQSWIDAMNARDPERVVALYDPEAVL